MGTLDYLNYILLKYYALFYAAPNIYYVFCNK